jgi:phosphocarrier protein
MGLMMLAATQGTHICVTAYGYDAQAAINKIKALFANRFGEDE